MCQLLNSATDLVNLADKAAQVTHLPKASGLAKRWVAGDRALALFAGLAAHSMLPLGRVPSAGGRCGTAVQRPHGNRSDNRDHHNRTQGERKCLSFLEALSRLLFRFS
jgi:hypothetical protein